MLFLISFVLSIIGFASTNIPLRDNNTIHNVISITYKHNSNRFKNEHKVLNLKNPYLYNMLKELNEYTNETFQKGIVVTMIYRTKKEQDYLYRNSTKYKKKKFTSPHQYWQAIDIRSTTFSQSEIALIVAWLNAKYNSDNYYKWTAKCHDVGSGVHFHIQFSHKTH